MSPDQMKDLNEEFRAEREAKAQDTQRNIPAEPPLTPANELDIALGRGNTPDEELSAADLNARGDALFEEAERLHAEATRLYRAADRQETAEPPQTPAELVEAATTLQDMAAQLLKRAQEAERQPAAPTDEDYRALRVRSDELADQAADMHNQAEDLDAKAARLFRESEALRTGQPVEEIPDPDDEPIFVPEARDANGYLTNEARRARRAWLAVGYLVDCGAIRMPNFDLLSSAAHEKAVDHVQQVYNDVLGLLELIDKA